MARLHHRDESSVDLEVSIPTLTAGPFGTLAIAGVELSRSVLAIAIGAVGAGTVDSLAGCCNRTAQFTRDQL